MIVRGTPEAIREEIEHALGSVRGKGGEAMRKKMGELTGEIRRKRQGEWEETVREFGQWGRE